jgi:hypothetical protein
MTTYYEYCPNGKITGIVESAALAAYPDYAYRYDPIQTPLGNNATTPSSLYDEEYTKAALTYTYEARGESKNKRPHQLEQLILYKGNRSSGSDVSTYIDPDHHQNLQNGYPDVESIRHLHCLHSLLGWILPERLHNSLYGPTLDIVEEGTRAPFAYRVPKKLLVLFIGRAVVSRYLRTLDRQDIENWEGYPTLQELIIPRGAANHVGFKILIAWMKRACYYEKMDSIEPIRVPKNLFAAISLARLLVLFGLHRDASRVDNYIARKLYKRPLFIDEIRSIWKCLPKNSKYTYRMVEDIRAAIIDEGYENKVRNVDEVLEFLEEQPDLKARVHSKDINDNFKPYFGTEWCKKAAEAVTEIPVFRQEMMEDVGFAQNNMGSPMPSESPPNSITEKTDVPYVQQAKPLNKKVKVLRIVIGS